MYAQAHNKGIFKIALVHSDMATPHMHISTLQMQQHILTLESGGGEYYHRGFLH